jgi:hypothetical protein
MAAPPSNTAPQNQLHPVGLLLILPPSLRPATLLLSFSHSLRVTANPRQVGHGLLPV